MPSRVTPSQAWRSAFRSWRIQVGDAPSELPPDPLDPDAPSSSSARKPSARSKAPVSAGGFVVEDDEEEEAAAPGGFQVDDDDDAGNQSASSAPPPYLPLSCIPDALSKLSPSYEDDETLLAIFKDVSLAAPRDFDTGSVEEAEQAGSSRRGGARIKVVQWDDWVKVVEALQGPEGEEDMGGGTEYEGEAEEEQDRPKTRRLRRRGAARTAYQGDDADSEDGSEGAFSLEEEVDDNDEEESDSDEYGGASSSRRKGSKTSTPRKSGRASGSATTRRKRKAAQDDDDDEEEAPRELTEDQLDVLDEIWAMFEERLASIGARLGPQGRIEKKHLEGILRSLNEKMGEKEIEEMLSEGAKLYVPLGGSNALRRRRGGDESVGKEELAGILLKARII